jgi:hypothetical protein
MGIVGSGQARPTASPQDRSLEILRILSQCPYGPRASWNSCPGDVPDDYKEQR